MKERWASLISGGGTTMEAMAKAVLTGEVQVEIACIISSNPQAGGLEKARKLGIPEENIIVINPHDFKEGDGKIVQERFGQALLSALKDHGVTVVTQNGWLPLTPELAIAGYPQRLFNQHPGPVPEFGGKGMYGRRVHAAVLLYRRLTGRDFWTEVIAQRVDKDYDRGAVVKRERVEIRPSDTVEDLQQRALPVEHRVQVDLLKDIAKGSLEEVTSREVLVRPGEEQVLFLAKKTAILLYPQG